MVATADPAIETVESVLYRPVSSPVLIEDPHWGLYHPSGALVESAAHLRGPDRDLIGGQWQLPWPEGAVPAAPAATYLYGGSFIAHFGHFLLSSVGRFWPFALPRLRRRFEPLPILVHAAHGLDYWFGMPFVAELLDAIGLQRERFVTFDRPTRIARLIVPAPSLVEMKQIHPAYLRLARHIGGRLLPERPERQGPPVWLSRTRVTPTTQAYDNEDALEAALTGFGIEVAYPESLSMSRKLQLFAMRRVVAGTIASGFHAAVFCPTPPASLVMLSPSRVVNANYGLLDRVAGLDARYYRPDADNLGIDLTRRIWSTFHLRDPAATAAGLLAIIQSVSRAARD